MIDERKERMDAIKARLAERTPGEWMWDDRDRGIIADGAEVLTFGDKWWSPDADDPDLILVIAAPSDMEWLIAEIERLEAARDD